MNVIFATGKNQSPQAPPLFTVPVIAIPETSTLTCTTVPPTIIMISPLPQLTTPSPAPTTVSTTTLIHALSDFLPCLDSIKEFLPWKRMDDLLSTRIRYATRTALQSYTKEFEKKDEEERKLYIDIVEKSIKDIINDESTINESLKNVILAKSSSQPKSTYEVVASLTEELYDGLVKSYNLDKDLFSSYGNVYSLKRHHEDEDKDEDPPAGSNQGLKKRKKSKDVEPPKGSKSKESKSSSSKGPKPQPKSSSKSTQVKEPVFEAANTKMQQDQGSEFGHTIDKPNGEAAPKSGWFKKPNKPLTLDHSWNTTKSINFRPPQTWINNIAKAREPPRTFDELMITPTDLSAYVMNHLKIDNLTQEILNNPEGHEYPFDLSKPLQLIEVQGRQVVPANYFFNNDLEYLKCGSSSRKYTTSTTKTKAAKYDNIEGIEDRVPTLWSPVKYDYRYLEEIIVQRDDQKLYKFMEGDFPRLNLCDIEDLLLLLRNKVETKTISLDNLYNNLKIYELELKDSTNTSQNLQNVAFVSSNSTNSNNSTNEADNTTYGVSTAHTQSSPTSGDNLSNDVICAFLASQPNSPQMSREDLEQIDPDDLEEMYLQ
ncbi:hypothetical protein Tco_1352951 [Tanacetum coccineum]